MVSGGVCCSLLHQTTETSRSLLDCRELLTSWGSPSINPLALLKDTSCKITRYPGDSSHAADSVGDFSLIKLGQLGLKKPLQGPDGKTQQDITQLMRTGHFSTLRAGSLPNCSGSAAKGAGYHCPSSLLLSLN